MLQFVSGVVLGAIVVIAILIALHPAPRYADDCNSMAPGNACTVQRWDGSYRTVPYDGYPSSHHPWLDTWQK